jgi:nitrite reductase (NO-forming)
MPATPATDDRAPAAPAVSAIRPEPRPVGRGLDRQITFAGLLVAAVLLGLAAAGATRLGFGGTIWLPLHLAMAGAASTAIAAALPFFTTALARVAPADPRLRIVAIALVAGGSSLAAVGMSSGRPALAAVGGSVYLAGMLALATAAFVPLRATIGFRLRLVHLAYAMALVQVGAGVALASLMLAGWAPVTVAWAALKPAHAWLNVFGFVALVVAASLVHLAPTVAGARIRGRRSASIALVGLMAGAPLVAVGMAAGWDVVARIGALVEVGAGVALAAHGAAVQRDRGRWTSDPGWHRLAGLSLLAAPAWLFVALAIGGARILWLGAVPAAWSVEALAVPLVAGFLGQVLVGAWTHLVPAIGPGDQAAHAIQRRWLGRAATLRWLAWNAGVALAAIGVPTANDGMSAAGGLLLAAALLAGLGLLAASVALSPWRARAVAVATRR